jgi:hypothetical protein
MTFEDSYDRYRGLLDELTALDRQAAALAARRLELLAGLAAEAMSVAEAAAPLGQEDRNRELAWRSTCAEIAAVTCTPLRTVQAQVGRAWALTRTLPGTVAALRAGRISPGHATAVLAEVEHLDAGHRADVEAELVELAEGCPVPRFRQRAAALLERREETALAARQQAAFAHRRVEFAPARDGMAELTLHVEAVDAAAVIRTGLRNAAQDARDHGDGRTRRQLEADLAVELLMNGTRTGSEAGGTGAAAAGRVRWFV